MSERSERANVHQHGTSTRAWRRLLSRVGIVVALAAGLGAGVATPAYAAPTDLSVTSSGGVTLQVGGGAKDASFTVQNNGFPVKEADVIIDVPLGGDGVQIIQGTDGCTVSGNSLRCSADFGPNESQNFFVKLKPPGSGGPAPGDSKRGQGQARVSYEDDTNDGNNSAGYTVTLKGPDKPKAVSGVSGTVKDEETKKPVANAKVSVKDSAGKEHTTATSSTGAFKLNSTDDQPIAAGALKFTITKSGYETKKLTKTGDAGATVRVETSMVPKASASGSASPPATESPGDTAPTAGAGGEKDEGINWLAWLMYLLAAALVLGGIGAIVWLFRRRDDEDEEYEDGAPDPRGPTPGARGAYHPDPYGAQTTVMGGAQPTTVMGAEQPTSMINRQPGFDQPTSMIDRTGIEQPTMSHPGPLADDGDDVYPAGRDKYAPGPGYGPTSGYGRRPEPEYGDGGYGTDRDYGDPGYQPRDSAGYGPAGSSDYGPAGPGGSGGHGSGDSGGYGSGGGRHSAGESGGGYGGHRDQGHDDRPGYGDSGHRDQGGYGDPPRRTGGGGRHSAGGDDRRLDWFED